MFLQLYYTKIYLILATTILLILKINHIPNNFFYILGAILLILAAFAYGSKKYPKKETLIQFSLGLFFILGITAFIGTIFFYLYKLSFLAIVTILFVIFINTKNPQFIFNKIKLKKIYFLQAIPLILLSFLFIIIFKSQSSGIIISPWDKLPYYFLPLFFCLTLIIILINKKWITGVYFILFFSIAAGVYALGFGFDQFIHEATQKYILLHGTITPKPLQYIGMYSVNFFLNKILGININILDKWLLPILTFIIPAIILLFLKKQKIKNNLPAFTLLLLPLSSFIVTTPQGLANLFLIAIILLSFTGFKKIWLPIATFFIHPITGIIALAYIIIERSRFKKAIAIFSIFALPLAFILLSYKISGTLNLNTNFIQAIKQYIILLTAGDIKQNYNLYLDLFYLIRTLLIPTIIIISIYTAYKKRRSLSTAPIIMFFVATASFILTSAIVDFSYLIKYEQQNFTIRIFNISLLFLLPYLVIAFDDIYKKTKETNLTTKIIFATIFSLFITSNLYLTYPRHDNYENFKGKNLSTYMINAVNLIREDAKDKNYIVLTDQSISAAALKIDGFKKYYSTPQGELFYYPIPTGDILYQEFLSVVYEKDNGKALKLAKTLTGVKIGYIALPSYWENYKKIKERLKTNLNILYEDKNIVIFKENNL